VIPGRRLRVCAYGAAALLSVLCSPVGADELQPPPGSGPLPDFSKGAKAGALVTAQHIHLYRSLLPPEISELVEQGEFAFEAVRAPQEPHKFGAAFEQAAELLPTGELKQTPSLPLRAGLFSVGQIGSGDTKQLAFKVLWNTAASLWRYPSIAVGVSAMLFAKADAAPHKLEFLIERLHPLALGAPPSTLAPLFREKISAKKPHVINGLAWLTLRFFGSSEDFVWVASPVVRGIRQLTGSNRSDQIFSGAFSLDDLLVWSGKVELVEPLTVSQMSLLVPVLESKAIPAKKQDGCVSVVYGGDTALTLQCQGARFQASGMWTPTNTFMALRSVYRIEFASRDPFSSDSRQVVYIDRDTGLPVYRIVWDQSGRRKKVILGIVRSLEFDAGQFVPTLAGQIVLHSQDGRRLALVYDSFTACTGYTQGRTLEDFDPSSFMRFPALPEERKKPTEGPSEKFKTE
jgi:hypothetical protein